MPIPELTIVAEIAAVASARFNRLQAADGIHRIELDQGIPPAAFGVGYDYATNVLTLENQTIGTVESIDIGAYAIADGFTQTVAFPSLGVSIILNAAFDKTIDLPTYGGAFFGANGSIDPATLRLIEASAAGGRNLTDVEIAASGLAPNAVDLSVGPYLAENVDLSTTGLKRTTLSFEDERFTIEYRVTEAFTGPVDATLQVGALGARFFAVEATPAMPPPMLIDGPASEGAIALAPSDASTAFHQATPDAGFESIQATRYGGDAAYVVAYEATRSLLHLENLTAGLRQAVVLAKEPIAAGDTRDVAFDALGLVITLNAAFDFDHDIAFGGAPEDVLGGVPIDASTIRLESATDGAGRTLAEDFVAIDGATPENARLTVGDFVAENIDLSTIGAKTARLTDGSDLLELSFYLEAPLTPGEGQGIRLDDLGQMLFTEARAAQDTTGDGRDEALHGTPFDDVLKGANGADRLFGYDGDDRLIGGGGDDRAEGGDGADILNGGGGADRSFGGAGDDFAIGGAGDDMLFGGAGDDRLRGGDDGDAIAGGADDDVIFGEAGDDVLHGDQGYDRLFGGAGADIFQFRFGDGVEKIYDFEDGVDRIDVRALFGVEDIDDLRLSTIRGGQDAKIAPDAEPFGPDFIVLYRFDIADVGAADFIF